MPSFEASPQIPKNPENTPGLSLDEFKEQVQRQIEEKAEQIKEKAERKERAQKWITAFREVRAEGNNLISRRLLLANIRGEHPQIPPNAEIGFQVYETNSEGEINPNRPTSVESEDVNSHALGCLAISFMREDPNNPFSPWETVMIIAPNGEVIEHRVA